MFKVICRRSAALLLLGGLLYGYSFRCANAQITPTNTATISGSVSDGTGKRVADAKVSITGPRNIATQTDAKGLFIFVGVPLGNYQITTIANNLGTATRSITIEGDTNVAIAYNASIVNGMKVIAQVKSVTTAQFNVTSASVTQVNPMEEAFQGETSWRKVLEQIPGVNQAGLYNGSNTLASVPDSPFMPMQISIDGTLPYETAVLFDGMPLIGSSYSAPAGSGTNIGLYALDGFSAADVVRGPGANAPSIVDSIGGSFVLHSPGFVAQNHYELSVSTDPYGGIITNALTAIRFHKLSVLATYGITNSPGPLASAGTVATNIPLQSVNGNSFSAYNPPGAGVITTPNYSGFPFGGYTTGLLISAINLGSGWSTHSGSLALNYAISPMVTVGIFYAGSTSTQYSTPVFTRVNFVPPSGYSGGIVPGSYTFDLGGLVFNDGTPYYQASSLLEEKVTAQFGKGILRLAALQNRTYSTCAYDTPDTANVRLYGAGYLNGSPTPTFFNGGIYTVVPQSNGYHIDRQTDNRDILASYTTSMGEKYHVGASYVKSYYNVPSFYDCLFLGFHYSGSIPPAVSETTDESRFFIGGNLSDKTSFDLSMYFASANYHVQDPNDFSGNTYVDRRYTYTAPRLGFVWRPTPLVSVRASAGGGFAEAPLGNLIGTNYPPFVNNPSAPTFYQVYLTNINLQPEKSFAFDIGADFRLQRDTVLSFDMYHANLHGQFYKYTALTTTDYNGTGLPLYTTSNGNLASSRYAGILLDLRHDVPRGIYWTLSGGLTRGFVVSVPAGFYDTATCTNCANLTVVPNVNFNGSFVASIPYAQGLGRFGYRWNSGKYVDLVATYYGNNNTYFRPAFVEFDGHVGYPITKSMSVLLTFRNITGIYDSAVQYQTLENLAGAPTIAGAPYALTGEMFGPRTVQLTVNVH